MTHSPDRGHGPDHGHAVPPFVARIDRGPAPSAEEIRDAEEEAKADILAAKREGITPHVSEAAQRVLDHAAADAARARIHELLGTHADAHDASGGHGHDGHGDSHGHDDHGHGHGSKPAKTGGMGSFAIGTAKGAAGVATVAAAGAAGKGLWAVLAAPYRALHWFGKNYAPDWMQWGEEGGAKKKPAKKADHGHGHGGGHGGGHGDHH